MNTQWVQDVMNTDEERRARAADLLYAQGLQMHGEERYADAAAVFRLMLRVAPTDERGWVALGDCHQRVGQNQVALELYGAGMIAAEPAPLCAIARFRTLWDLERTVEADEAFEEAQRLLDEGSDSSLVDRLAREREARP